MTKEDGEQEWLPLWFVQKIMIPLEIFFQHFASNVETGERNRRMLLKEVFGTRERGEALD